MDKNFKLISAASLWQRFKGGDIVAYENIYRANAGLLINYGLKIRPDIEIVKDALHDLFIEIWASRKNLSDTDNILFYLMKALRYKLLHLKGTIIEITEDLNPKSESTPESIFLHKEIEALNSAQIKKAINKIPLRQQEIIFLRFFCGQSVSEISELLAIKHQSVSNLLQRALSSLKAQIVLTKSIAAGIKNFIFSIL